MRRAGPGISPPTGWPVAALLLAEQHELQARFRGVIILQDVLLKNRLALFEGRAGVLGL